MEHVQGRHGRLLCITSCLFALLLNASAWSADARVAGGKTSVTVPFEMVDNRVFVTVKVNGTGPFHFILDTGVGGVGITPEAARQLGLTPAAGDEVVGVGEKQVSMGKTHLDRVDIGGIQIRDLEAEVFPSEDNPPVFGKAPMDGIIGLPLFESFVVRHDYQHKLLTFTVPDKFHYHGKGMVVPFIRPRQIPVVEGELDGVRGHFGIDTGARSSLLLYGPFVEQNHLRTKYHARVEGVTGWGLGGPVRSQLARASELKLGAVTVHDLVIRLSLQHSGATTSSAMAGLVGPDVLSQFSVTFDYSRQQIIFEPNPTYGRHDTWDRAGMWLGQDGDQYRVVDVIAGSPAEEAGIKVDDRVLAIDGTSVAKLALSDVRQRMRTEPPGRAVTLRVESAGLSRTVVIKLRDLV